MNYKIVQIEKEKKQLNDILSTYKSKMQRFEADIEQLEMAF